MRPTLSQHLIAATAFCLSVSSISAWADGASQGTSSDVSEGTPINFTFGTSTITVKPWEIKANVGAGTQNTPEGKGRVLSIRIDASTRIPLALDGQRVYEEGGR